jgi:glycosyltransferase involved in cell wall biosynthesis
MVAREQVCCIFNFAPHYRTEIYLKMEQELNCIFYFGNDTVAKIKKMDYGLFARRPSELKYVKIFSQLNWLSGSVPLLLRPYKKYILTGEPYCLSTWLFLLLSRIFRKKVLLWSHGWYGDESPLKLLIKKAFFFLADGTLLYGNYARNIMVKHGFRADGLYVIYNSLAYSEQIKVRASVARSDVYSRHFSNNNPTFIFIGRIGKKKKVEMLIDLLLEAKAAGKLYNLVIVGDGPEIQSIQAKVKAAGIANQVWFVGASYDETYNANLIFNADLCISPGEVGLTGIHALMYGTPVITHDNFSNQMPEFEAIQPGITGNFFRENNTADLLRRVNDWISAHPSKTKELAESCFAVVDKFYNPSRQLEVLNKALAANEITAN